MALAFTSLTALAAHVEQLGVKNGARLVVHSRLLAFGMMEDGAAGMAKVLRAAIGPKGTLVVPTYTLDRHTIYDRATTPSQNVGVLPEIVRQIEGAVRSACPMHNHAAIGRDAALLNAPTGHFSLGAGSDFELLLREDFTLLLLGAGITEGATFVHHVEALEQVPYRIWLDLQRSVRSGDGPVGTMACRYYGRRDMELHESFDMLETPLLAAQQVSKVKAPYGFSRLITLAALSLATHAALKQNPYCLVKS